MAGMAKDAVVEERRNLRRSAAGKEKAELERKKANAGGSDEV